MPSMRSRSTPREINEVGQFSRAAAPQLHHQGTAPNPITPARSISNHALNGTPEFAYGVTPWLELGLYIPWAVNEQGQFLSNNFKLRTLFVTPDAAKKDFFYGLNFEYDFPSWPFVPDALRDGGAADHRLAQSAVGVHHQPDHRFRLGRTARRRRFRAGRPARAQSRRGPLHRARILLGPRHAREIRSPSSSSRTNCSR